MKIDELRKSIGWNHAPDLLRDIVSMHARQRLLVFTPPWVSLASHVSKMSPADAKARAGILELLEENRSQPPRVHEIAKLLRVNEIHARRLCKEMARSGTLVEVAADRFFLRDAVVAFAIAAQELAGRGREFTAAAFRDEIKCGRTAAIQLARIL